MQPAADSLEGQMTPNLDWAMSPAAFERDWPPPRLENGIYYIVPAGVRYGYGAALTKEAAAWQHAAIREPHARLGGKVVWC